MYLGGVKQTSLKHKNFLADRQTKHDVCDTHYTKQKADVQDKWTDFVLIEHDFLFTATTIRMVFVDQWFTLGGETGQYHPGGLPSVG